MIWGQQGEMRMKEEIRQKLRHGSAIATILIIVASLAAGAFGAAIWVHATDNGNTAAVEPSEEPTPEPTPEVSTASFFFVGDALLHETIPYDAQKADGTYDFTPELHRIGAIAQNYDLRYYNQETILAGDEYGIHGYPCFNGPRAWGDTMVDTYGFNMVSLANNHSLDMGEDGTIASTEYWKTKKNVVASGTYTSLADRQAITVHEINGIKYAFFSWTYGMNGIPEPEDAPYMVACYDGNEDEMCKQIAEAKKVADVVIVAMHWGTEYVFDATEEQQRLAQEVSDAGADIIIGNHPHVIGPVQWLNNGKTICFYAMGNLCAAQYDKSRIEMMGALNIEKTSFNGQTSIKIKNVKADLMYQYVTDNWTNFEIVPFAQMTDDTYLADHQAVYDQYKTVITSLDPTIQIGGF